MTKTCKPKPVLQKLIQSKGRLALIANHQVVEFIIVPPNHFLLGTVLTARITAKAPGGGYAYFAALPNNQIGFLQSPTKLNNGTKILAVVTKEAHGKKYAKLSLKLPDFPPEDMEKFTHEANNSQGPAILYTPDIITELQKIYDIDSIITDGIPVAPDSFTTEGIEDELAAALEPLVITCEGVHIFIEKTQAFWTIDVDAGSSVNLSHTDINLIAAQVIAKHIRQRNMGGQIVIDFISSPKMPLSGKVVECLKVLFADDPTPTTLIDVTPLGHVEVVRHCHRLSLAEGMALMAKDKK